jgi:hypothetical protein
MNITYNSQNLDQQIEPPLTSIMKAKALKVFYGDRLEEMR